jgi:hypothetical protein
MGTHLGDGNAPRNYAQAILRYTLPVEENNCTSAPLSIWTLEYVDSRVLVPVGI